MASRASGGTLQALRLVRKGQNAFTVTVGAAELSSLIAAVRLAADVLQGDPRTPAQAVEQLRRLLQDYERAAAHLDETADEGD